MTKQHQELKRCLSAAASKYRIKFSEFDRSRNLGDFLLDEALNPSSPQELVASALAELCVGDAGTMDLAVCTAVVQFLDRKLKARWERQDQMRRLKDLLVMLREGANHEQYLAWANVWHP